MITTTKKVSQASQTSADNIGKLKLPPSITSNSSISNGNINSQIPQNKKENFGKNKFQTGETAIQNPKNNSLGEQQGQTQYISSSNNSNSLKTNSARVNTTETNFIGPPVNGNNFHTTGQTAFQNPKEGEIFIPFKNPNASKLPGLTYLYNHSPKIVKGYIDLVAGFLTGAATTSQKVQSAFLTPVALLFGDKISSTFIQADFGKETTAAMQTVLTGYNPNASHVTFASFVGEKTTEIGLGSAGKIFTWAINIGNASQIAMSNVDNRSSKTVSNAALSGLLVGSVDSTIDTFTGKLIDHYKTNSPIVKITHTVTINSAGSLAKTVIESNTINGNKPTFKQFTANEITTAITTNLLLSDDTKTQTGKFNTNYVKEVAEEAASKVFKK